jgi:hypothetical protein
LNALILIAALLSQSDAGSLPPDAPIAVVGETPLGVTMVQPGDEVPGFGCFLPEQLCVTQAKRIVGCEAERDELRKQPEPPAPAIWIAVILGSALAGAGAVFAWQKITQRPDNSTP